MARPRAFDPDLVLEAAMRVFWSRGFVATSMADIYAATGLKPGNLYSNFQDKETLFRRAFEAYAARFRDSLPKEAEGRAAILEWLAAQARLATEDPERKGCLIVNTITERGAHPPETRALAEARLAEICGFFRHHLRLAVERGEVAPGADVERLADALTGSVVAIMSLGRAGAPAAMIGNVAEQAAGMVG